MLLLGKPGFEQYFEPELVLKLARSYGGLLPHPVLFTARGETARVNSEPPPWALSFSDPAEERAAFLRFGREMFKTDFPDYVRLRSETGGVEGAAFVLAEPPGISVRKTHRVYLKGMLLSEEAEGLLPDWAFFVKCVIDARDLRPSASRETFHEDVLLRAARKELGQCLKQHLMTLAAEHPEGLQQLISTHAFSIKALSAEDDECFRTFREWLPFETNMGRMTMGELLRQGGAVRYVTNLDEFRQVSGIAAAQDLCLVNGVYAFDQALLAKLAAASPEVTVERVDVASLTMNFGRPSLAEEERLSGFLVLARDALAEFGCEVQVRRFEPRDLPAVYLAGSDAVFHRAVEESKEVADPLWSSILDGVAEARSAAAARLCLNLSNRLVSRVVELADPRRLWVYVRMLYLQALLLGHRPPGRRELKALNEALTLLLEDGAGADKEGGPHD